MYPAHGRTKKRWLTDLTGRVFGRLTVVGFSERRGNKYYWHCTCSCGSEAIVERSKLKSATRPTQSCGCLTREATRERSTVHGHNRAHKPSPEYNSWRAMMQRCTNPRDKFWHRYGGRGIRVCERWHAFENFLADMGEKPSPKHSVDRVNNDGNYEPSNCRWASTTEQSGNTSAARLVEFQGRKMPLNEAARLSGIDRRNLYNRLHNLGWPDSELFTPVRAVKKR